MNRLSGIQGDSSQSPGHSEDGISSDVQSAYDTVQNAQNVLTLLEDRCGELERMIDIMPSVEKEIRSQIDQSIQMVQRAVSERQEYLMNELQNVLKQRTEKISKMHEDFETRLQRLSSHVDLLKRLTQPSEKNGSTTTSTSEVPYLPQKQLATQKHKQEIEKILSMRVQLHPSECDTMAFYPTELDHLLSMIRCVGTIGISSIDPSKTAFQRPVEELDSVVHRCLVNEQDDIGIVPKDSFGRLVSNSSTQDFLVTIHPRLESANEICLRERIQQNDVSQSNHHKDSCNDQQIQAPLYVSCRIGSPGSYDLCVKLYGEHIQGSPLILHARSHLRPDMVKIMETMKTLSYLPERINPVLNKRRRCKSLPSPQFRWDDLGALADECKLDKGDFLYSFGTKGRNEGEFANPTGICVTRENKILVADCNNACIQVYDSSARFMFRIGEYGFHPGQLMRPTDVAETINGNYLVTDYEAHCVTVYTPTGAYMSRFGQRYLSGPRGIIADSRGRILVVDQKACMVCIFKPTGKFINRFGSRGMADNQFVNPMFVAVNYRDEIYVSDYVQHVIKVFDPNGLYLFKIGVHGLEPGMLHSPTGLTFDKHNCLYVSDWGNNRIQLFRANGDYVRTVNSLMEPLNGPYGLTYQPTTNRLLVTDPGNYCVKVYEIRESPSSENQGESGVYNHSDMRKSSSATFSFSATLSAKTSLSDLQKIPSHDTSFGDNGHRM